MKEKKFITSIYITDKNIGIYNYNLLDNSLSSYANEELPESILNQGYIKEPKAFLKAMKSALKKLQKKPREIHWVIQDSNILIREITINKSKLVDDDIKSYLDKQIGVSIHYPFDLATYSYDVVRETETDYIVSMFICDQDLIEDYLDIFEKAGIRSVYYNILSPTINTHYTDEEKESHENTMIVTVLNNTISVSIVEKGKPVFATMDECPNTSENDCSNIIDYIDRIAHYYRFNLRKDKEKITNVLIVDSTNEMRIDRSLDEYIKNNETEYKITKLKTSDIDSKLKDAPNNISVAYLSSKAVEKDKNLSIKFHLNRPKRSILIANYLFVLAITIFAVVSLVYIPLANMKERVSEQQLIVDALEIQKQMLIENVESNNTFSNYEITYNETYSFLDAMRPEQIFYMESLIGQMDNEMTLLKFSIDKSDSSIELTIQSDSTNALYEYIIRIYEAYGIGLTDDEGKWISEYPTFSFIANNTMKVVIYYA